MLTLYYKPTCPFCQSVLGEAEALNIQLRLKDISADQELKEELRLQGGQVQVPFLIDTEKGIKLYESPDIIAHFHAYYSDGTQGSSFGGLKVHQSEEICDTCQ